MGGNGRIVNGRGAGPPLIEGLFGTVSILLCGISEEGEREKERERERSHCNNMKVHEFLV